MFVFSKTFTRHHSGNSVPNRRSDFRENLPNLNIFVMSISQYKHRNWENQLNQHYCHQSVDEFDAISKRRLKSVRHRFDLFWGFEINDHICDNLCGGRRKNQNIKTNVGNVSDHVITFLLKIFVQFLPKSSPFLQRNQTQQRNGTTIFPPINSSDLNFHFKSEPGIFIRGPGYNITFSLLKLWKYTLKW